MYSRLILFVVLYFSVSLLAFGRSEVSEIVRRILIQPGRLWS